MATKIKVTQSLKTIDGKPMKQKKVVGVGIVDGKQVQKLEDGGELKVRDILVDSLLADHEDEKGKLSADEKLKRFILATDIQKNSEIELKSEQVVLIKQLVAKSYNTLIVGQIMQIID